MQTVEYIVVDRAGALHHFEDEGSNRVVDNLRLVERRIHLFDAQEVRVVTNGWGAIILDALYQKYPRGVGTNLIGVQV